MAMSFNFIRYKKIWFAFSGILVLTALTFLFMWGLNPGIEFTGGSSLEVYYQEEPSLEEVRSKMDEFDFPSQVTLVSDDERTGAIIKVPRKSCRTKIKGRNC